MNWQKSQTVANNPLAENPRLGTRWWSGCHGILGCFFLLCVRLWLYLECNCSSAENQFSAETSRALVEKITERERSNCESKATVEKREKRRREQKAWWMTETHAEHDCGRALERFIIYFPLLIHWLELFNPENQQHLVTGAAHWLPI